MNDLISRQAAIGLVRDICDAVMSGCESMYDSEIEEEVYKDIREVDAILKCNKELRIALRNLRSAEPEQRWIPCSERLPEEKDAGILKKLGTKKSSEYVLATVETNGERMTVTACTYDGAWNWNMKYAFPEYDVIAWMPLPEPYAERSE